MHQETIQKLVEEIRPLLKGHYLGKIFQLGTSSFAIDFGLREGRYLFISADPTWPRFYLIRRRVKHLEKESTPPSQFALTMRLRFSGAAVLNVSKDSSERVVRLTFQAQDETGKKENRTLVAQLTGRSANLFLLDSQGGITHSLRSPRGSGQSPGEPYQPPEPQTKGIEHERRFEQGEFDSLSAALDSHDQREKQERVFQLRAKGLQDRLRKEIRQKAKLMKNLQADLAAHGNAQTHKRLGELLLANISTAERSGSKVVIKDFYTDGTPSFELELDENSSLQEEAARHFARYTKAKRATKEIGKRLVSISQENDELRAKEAMLEHIIDQHDEAALTDFEVAIQASAPGGSGLVSRRSKVVQGKRREAKIPGVRAFRSSDGYEILVGRGANDNDYLTFRVAKPNDLWLHAADYPGSHVVVPRKNRNEIPHQTIIEAAQLAARFSHARKDSKVVVHYTQRKFLSKPKGVAPGLVRMSSFKTILVEPKQSVERV